MRRKDRQVSDLNSIIKVVENSNIIRLAFSDKYIVPLCYGYEVKEGKLFFYFHSAQKGRKIDILREDSYVGFEIEGRFDLVASSEACKFTARFESIVGLGTVSLLEDAEKEEGLLLIMKHLSGKYDWILNDAILSITNVYKLEVQELCCKSNYQ